MDHSSDWIFLGGRLTSIQDVDAALSASEDDFHGTARSYVARIACAAFREVAEPSFDMNNDEWRSIARRLNGANLVLLPALPTSFESGIQPTLANAPGARPLRYIATEQGGYRIDQIDEDELNSLRDADLCRIVDLHSRRAVLMMNDGHFQLPSGAHTSHFFRLAECLASVNEIDSLVYWVSRDFERFLGEAREGTETLLLVDNPSMLVLAVRLTQVFPRLHIEYACLNAYPDSQNVADDLVEWLTRNGRGAERVYWLVGVTSTGNLSVAIEAACRTRGLGFASSAIYSTTPGVAGNVYCNLEIEKYKHFENVDSCTICNSAEGSPVFKIDKSRYFLSERNVVTTSLPPPLFEQQKNFIAKYGHIDDVLLTHVDDPNDESPRHHTFYVDVNRLLDVSEFKTEVIQAIKLLDPQPDLVVIPRHMVGTKMAALVHGECGLPIYFHSTLRLSNSNPEEFDLAKALSAAKSLLILDDLSFTGKRLQVYNCSLRESGTTFDPPPNVVFFPLIALPEDLLRWGKMERGIKNMHPDQTRKIQYLYRFIMPHWDRSKCPWCAESREFEKLDAFDDTDMDVRGTRLADTKSGLRHNGWINFDDELAVPAFGKQSFILDGGATSMQVLFACASAIQQARVGHVPQFLLDPDGFPKSTVLDVAVIRDFQNETLIVISLLRCLFRDEVDENFKKYVCETAVQIAATLGHHDLWALRDLLLASKRGLARAINDNAAREKTYAVAKFDAFAKT